MRFWVTCTALICIAVSAAEPGADPHLRVDCDVPGGNIVVDSIRGDTGALRQDLRDTKGFWFYWYFRARCAPGRTATFRFTKGNVIGVRGPAVSVDGGSTWRWLGTDAVEGTSFRFTFPHNVTAAQFCFGMPYVERNLREFLLRHGANPHLKEEVLCRSRKGRTVKRLRVGNLNGTPRYRILLTCRHHACEMMASYSLEGILDAVLAESEEGAWFRQNAELLAIPFMDKDGVEDGDQGKNRMPHDHNRDYAGESIYPTVRTLRSFVPAWSEGRLRVVLDMHCPYIRGTHNENVYMVGTPDKANWERTLRLARLLEKSCRGPIPFRTEDCLPFGTAWNTYTGPLKSCSRWGAGLPGVLAATTIEIPYANARGVAVTAQTARALGRDLARALRRFLQTSGEKQAGG